MADRSHATTTRVILIIEDLFNELGDTAPELQANLQAIIDEGEGTDDGTPNIRLTVESVDVLTH